MKATDNADPKKKGKPERGPLTNLTRIQAFALQSAWTPEAAAHPDGAYDTANDYRCALQIQMIRDQDKGHPVWLASVSMQPRMARKRMRTTDQWTQSEIEEATEYLHGLTMNRGDRSRWMLFQTQINLCLAVALNDAELAALPRMPTPNPRELPRFVAGAYTLMREIVGFRPEACLPCENPTRSYPFTQGVPDDYLFVLAECGVCATCAARMDVVVAFIGKKLPAHEQPAQTGDAHKVVPVPPEKLQAGQTSDDPSALGEGGDS